MSGTLVNRGWVLTPQSKSIPFAAHDDGTVSEVGILLRFLAFVAVSQSIFSPCIRC